MAFIWNIILTSVLILPAMTQVAGYECQPDCSGASCSCPNDLFLYSSMEYTNVTNCIYPTTLSDMTSVSSPAETTTPSVPFSINNTNETDPSTPVSYICVPSCPRGYYGNGSNICVLCNALCLNCSDSGITADVCGCKYGNNNGTCLSQVVDAKDQNEKIIIGAAVGGGVLLVVVIILVVCCCCRRKQRGEQTKTRMSVLLQDRDDTVDSTVHIIEQEKPPSEPRNKLTTLQRQNYENTGKFDDKKFAKQAQLNQDIIFRYVKDPVTGKNKKIIEEPNKRDSDIYSNAPAIKLNKHFHGAATEEKEISMLPVAPKPPGFKKKKKSIFKFSLRKTTSNAKEEVGTSNRAFKAPDDQENYEDMSGKQEEQPNYAPFDPNIEGPQEDYMNYEQDQNRDEMPQEDYANFSNTALTVEDEEQEDYENVQKALSKANMDDIDEQEDYENFSVSPRTNQTAVNDEEPSEDYQNYNSENPYMNVTYTRK